tara:strand:+ start:522 stop:1166 length:645 start_codon:yes stop_codon:yes gene_type:complete
VIKRQPGEEMNPEAVEAFSSRGYPIPGQSWTQPVEERRPFEGKPDFTDMREALEATALELLDEENYVPIVLAMGDGVPVMDLALQIGYVGFRDGRWNPDLMLMLLEPFAYLLMALAEKSGVKYRIDSDDVGANLDMDDGDADEEEAMLVEKAKNVAQVAARKKVREAGGVPDGVLPTEIVEKIEALPEVGLLDRQPEEMVEPDNDSLLARGEDE